MNYRYTQIIATCLIAGTLTFALKKSTPAKIEDNNLVQDITQPRATDSKKQGITLKPEITKKNLSYKYGMFSYSPTKIALSVNDNELSVGDDEEVTVAPDKDGTITTHCKWTFPAGYKGEKKATWKVKPGAKDHAVTFDWDSPGKIQIEDAELVSTEG